MVKNNLFTNNNIYILAALIVFIIMLGVILGLTIVNLIDKRLSNISIKIPDQHIYLKLDDKQFKLNNNNNTIKLPISNMSNIPSSYINNNHHYKQPIQTIQHKPYNLIETFDTSNIGAISDNTTPSINTSNSTNTSINTSNSTDTSGSIDGSVSSNDTSGSIDGSVSSTDATNNTTTISVPLNDIYNTPPESSTNNDINKNIIIGQGNNSHIDNTTLTNVINTAIASALKNNNTHNKIENYDNQNINKNTNFYSNMLYSGYDPQNPLSNTNNITMEGYNTNDYNL
jgi:hypothetical protein